MVYLWSKKVVQAQRVFPDRIDQNCDELSDRLTNDFALLGHLVLQEYA